MCVCVVQIAAISVYYCFINHNAREEEEERRSKVCVFVLCCFVVCLRFEEKKPPRDHHHHHHDHHNRFKLFFLFILPLELLEPPDLLLFPSDEILFAFLLLRGFEPCSVLLLDFRLGEHVS